VSTVCSSISLSSCECVLRTLNTTFGTTSCTKKKRRVKDH
jgi:hypothetical protein